MSILSRIRQKFGISPKSAVKASPNNPQTNLANPASWLFSVLGMSTKSGATVNNETVVGMTAVWRAIALIAESIASLPAEIIQKDQNGNIQMAMDHPNWNLLTVAPSRFYTAFDFFYAMTVNALLDGNSYATFELNERTGLPQEFIIRDTLTNDIAIFIDPDTDQLFYRFSKKDSREKKTPGGKLVVPAERVIHFKWWTTNGMAGLQTITVHKDNLGLGLSARDFGNTFLKNGVFMSGYVSVPQTLTQDAYDRLSTSLNKTYGGVPKAGKMAVLEQGAAIHGMTIKPQEASMLDIQKFSIEDISRIFGVPPHLLASLDRATFNNIEQLSLEFGKYTIRPWIKRIEQELNRKIFRPAETGRFKVNFNMNAFLRGDSESRAKLYDSAMKWGWMTINEIRKLEGLNPVADGDKNLVPLNMIPAGMVEDISRFAGIENITNGINRSNGTDQ